MSLIVADRLFKTSYPQTEKARLPNCVLVRQTTADLVDNKHILTTLGVTYAKSNEVLKVWPRTLHNRSNFEHDSELTGSQWSCCMAD